MTRSSYRATARSNFLLVTRHSSLVTFLTWFDHQHWAARVAYDGLGGRAEEYAPEACAPVRRDYDESRAALPCHAHDLGGGLAVGRQVFDFEPRELLALREGGQVARRPLVKALAQLEAAVKELLQQIEKDPRPVPQPPAYPVIGGGSAP